MRYCKYKMIPCNLATKDGYCQITACAKKTPYLYITHPHYDHYTGLVEVIKSQKNTSLKN